MRRYHQTYPPRAVAPAEVGLVLRISSIVIVLMLLFAVACAVGADLFSVVKGPVTVADTEPVGSGPDDSTPVDQPGEVRERMQQRIDDARKVNRDKYRALLTQGEKPDPYTVLLTRMESLVDLLLSDEEKLALDAVFEARMTGVLNACLASLRQRQLMTPSTAAPPGLLVPGR